MHRDGDVAPRMDEKVPELQSEQVAAPISENVPSLHSEQLEAVVAPADVEKYPASHRVHDELPDAAHVPA